jgi:multidrug efflux pump subunit AcrA (membrane-fusion protein)
VTEWTAKSELFMEYAPFIVGAESRFLAHITVLDGFGALLEGDVTVTLTMKGGAAQVATASRPTRPGIFIPTITPKTAGECSLTVEIRGNALVDSIDAGPCRVFPDRAAAEAALGGDDGDDGSIQFLKEQQWVIDFGTAPVGPRELQPSLTVNAEIRTMPGREAHLTAATVGRVSLADPAPTLGADVAKGDLLAQIQPTTSVVGSHGALRADVDAASAEYAAATAQRDRLARLVADDAVPRRRLDDAEATVKVTKARLSAATTRLAAYNASASGGTSKRAGAFRVRAPIGGTLVDVFVTEGKVYEPDVPKVETATTAWFTVEGRETVFEITERTGKLVTVGHVIDPRSRTVNVVFELDNPGAVLRVGQYAKLSVATGPAVSVLAVPESALLQEGGQWIAFVQIDGEGFARRVVQTGIRSRGWVQVLGGLADGEHVVTRGAYDLKRAASAGDAPAHGHAH